MNGIASRWERVLASPWTPMLAYLAFALLLARDAAGPEYLTHRDGDGRMLLLPYAQFAATHLSQGDVPFWNPAVFAGMPHLSSFLPGLCYPTTLFLAIIPAPAVMTGHVLVHLVIAAMGARAWSLQRGATPGGAAIAGLCWAFGWSVLGQAAWGTTPQVAALAWMPWTCCWAERTMDLVPGRVPRWRDLVATAAGLTLIAFSGHIQYLYLTTLLLVLLALAGGIPLGRRWWRPGLRLAPAGLLGGALAAVQLLPGVLFLGESSRAGGLAAGIAASYNLPPRHLILSATPGILGPDLRGSLPYWGEWNAFDGIASLPLPAFILAACATLSGGRRHGLWFAGIAGVLLALGAATPAYGLAEWVLPGLGNMRTPSRFSVFAVLAIAMLAGQGASALLGDGVAARRAARRAAWLGAGAAGVTATLTVLLLAGGVEGSVWQEFVTWFRRSNDRLDGSANGSLGFMQLAHGHTVTVLIVTCALASLTAGLAFYRALGQAPTRLTAALLLGLIGVGAAASVGGALPVMAPGHLTLPFSTTKRLGLEDPQVRWINDTNSPNIALSDGTRSLGGWGPMIPARTARLLERSEGVERGTPLFVQPLTRPSPVWDAAAVRYVVSGAQTVPEPGSLPHTIEQLPGWTHRTPDAGVRVYERDRPVARARLVYRAETAASPAQALDWVAGGRHHPEATTVLEAPSPELPATPPTGGTVRFVVDSPDRIELETDSSAPALLVLSDAWASGWSVSLDGRPATALHADYGFRAVAVPAGRHAVEWIYSPPGLPAGIVISLLALCASVALIIWERRARAARPDAAAPA